MSESLALSRSRLPALADGLRSVAVTGVICLAACFALACAPLTSWLEFDRAAIAGGQWWRVATGHLAHWNADHFFWDVLMFGVLGGVCERIDRARFVACIALSATAISAAIWWLLPEVNCYRGLSGADSALFTLVAVSMLHQARRDRDPILAAILALGLLGFVAKLAYEIATGTTVFVNSPGAGFVPLPLVHAVGGTMGAMLVGSVHFLQNGLRETARERAG